MQRLRIAHPVIEDVGKWTMNATGPAILLSKRDIVPGVLSEQFDCPTMCRVQGVLTENGRAIELIIPITEWNRLRTNPVNFTQDDHSGPLPIGAILDVSGRIINRKGLRVF